ncbi:hypothetical protein AB1Y20_022574 [Prymnesium parvum]|uniref:Serine/threonine-protein kinase TOR n=1 Tax=Prymnesium parvum TaxID=97485 RepID=A0AB34JJT2_PRYPA
MSDPVQRRRFLSSLLIRVLSAQHREQMLPDWNKYSNEFYTLIYEDVTSNIVEKQLLGVQYILEVLRLEVDDRASMVTNFANCLQQLNSKSSEPEVLQKASHALGELAKVEGGSAAVEPLLKQALQRLRTGNKLESAVLVIEELAKNAPTLTYVHVKEVLDHMWDAVFHLNVVVRDGAANALHACLALVAGRESRARTGWYAKVFEEAQRGFSLNLTEASHGALLTTTELLGASGAHLTERDLTLLFESAWALRDHRERFMRRAALALLPRFAQHCAQSSTAPQLFVSKYFDQSLDFMLDCLRSSRDEMRPYAFVAIGDVALYTRSQTRRPSMIVRQAVQSLQMQETLQQRKTMQRTPTPDSMQSSVSSWMGSAISGLKARVGSVNAQHAAAEEAAAVEAAAIAAIELGGDGARRGVHPLTGLLDKVLAEVKANLQSKKTSKKPVYCDQAIVCVAKLAEAMPQQMGARMEELMPYLFSSGITPTLSDAMESISHFLPDQAAKMKAHVLDAVLGALARMSFSEWSRMSAHERAAAFAATAFADNEHAGPAQVALALQTLGTFNSGDWSNDPAVLSLVLECAGYFLDAQPAEIRRAAAADLKSLAFGSLFAGRLTEPITRGNVRTLLYAQRPSSATELSGVDSLQSARARMDERARLIRILSEVLQKVLITGAVDPESSIRSLVCTSLGTRYDAQLAQPDALRCIFLWLNDERFDIRLASASILGRLGHVNPALVLPAIRTKLMQLLTEVEYSMSPQVRQQAAQLLGTIADSAASLIEPYAPSILAALSGPLADSSANVAAAALTSVSQLARVSAQAVKPHTTRLITRAIDGLRDQSSAIRRASLGVIAQVVRASGDASKAYRRHPSLLPRLLSMLKSEHLPELRLELLRALGVLGALDPAQQTMNVLKLQRNASQQQGSRGVAADRHGEPVQTLGAAHMPTEDHGQAESPMPQGMNSSHPDYYHTVAILALVSVLGDRSLAKQHKDASKAIVHIFSSVGSKSSEFLPVAMPPLLRSLASADRALGEIMLKHLCDIVAITKREIQPYVPAVVEKIRQFWSGEAASEKTQRMCISLIEGLSVAIGDAFTFYLPELLPMLLAIFQTETSPQRTNTRAVLQALNNNLMLLIDDFLYMVLSAALQLLESTDAPLDVRTDALRYVGSLAAWKDVSSFSSPIVHSLLRTLDGPYPQLRTEAVDTLYGLAYRLGAAYLVYEPAVRTVMRRAAIKDVIVEKYEVLVHSISTSQQDGWPGPSPILINSDPDPSNEAGSGIERGSYRRYHSMHADIGACNPPRDGSTEDAELKRHHLNLSRLSKAWDTRNRLTPEDWQDWFNHFSLELLRESPSPALRGCMALAERSAPLTIELFNAAFVCCWEELLMREDYGATSNLKDNLETAMEAEQMPHQLLQRLLNLAEFMERGDKPLGIRWAKLGWLSSTAHAYAKALHYKEIVFESAWPSSTTIEALITINKDLQQFDSARGILEYARTEYPEQFKESWYEKLQDWTQALQAYERMEAWRDLDDDENLGVMRCHLALGDWEPLASLAQRLWQDSISNNLEMRNEVAILGAYAEFNLAVGGSYGTPEHWSKMQGYARDVPTTLVEGCIFNAVLAIHEGELVLGQEYVDRGRTVIDRELTALVNESYNRAYGKMVQLQQLAELEEIISHRASADAFPAERLVSLWGSRLLQGERSVHVWKNLLSLHALAINPEQNRDTLLKFCHMCQKAGRHSLARRTLYACGVPEQSGEARTESVASISSWSGRWENELADVPLQVQYAYATHLWGTDDPASRAQALDLLGEMLKQRGGPLTPDDTRTKAELAILAKSWLRYGKWELQGDLSVTRASMLSMRSQAESSAMDQALERCANATQLDPTSYKAWHALAMLHFDVVQSEGVDATETEEEPVVKRSRSSTLGVSLIQSHVVPAVEAFFRSIALGEQRKLQDILRLLTLWFQHGSDMRVDNAMSHGLNITPIDTWLAVMPQIIARIHNPKPTVRQAVLALLERVAQAHPQGLVYPLTVASNSRLELQHRGATQVLDQMRKGYDTLVQQAHLVSNEFIRAAALWPELWQAALEEASRAYFGKKDADAMLAILEPRHQQMQRGPATLSEITFQQAFGRQLDEAYAWCQRYKQSRDLADINAAWELYYHAFKRIMKQVAKITKLELSAVSPELLNATKLELAVPGTYQPDVPLVRIDSFARTMAVITSKQRPRKISLHGDDGIEYSFLLKGHEDLRQDERVMQLFNLVNTLLKQTPEAARSNLQIQRYSVIPLSPNSGLIGWVANCDTFHSLIQNYRAARNIKYKAEDTVVQRFAPDSQTNSGYVSLPFLQKLEVFKIALDQTKGEDLAQVLWLNSTSAERWLARRMNYTRSLAVMSMVGYILGLGDRHLSNLMFEQFSGEVVHIDFGDCFEVAIQRDKFPEKVPFRLTRMLVNAMGVSGIEGNFRCACESTMGVLRQQKDSVMAMLEAFMHDPLLNWGLNTDETDSSRQSSSSTAMREFKMGEVKARADRNAGSLIEVRRAGHMQEQSHKDEKLLNARAIKVLRRIRSKLVGTDFKTEEKVAEFPQMQVNRLIREARSHENLCQMFLGWNAFW